MVVIRSERSNVGPQRTLQFLFLIVSVLLQFPLPHGFFYSFRYWSTSELD